MKAVVTLLAVAALALATVLTTSCSTAAGLGRDLQTLGQGLERAAR